VLLCCRVALQGSSLELSRSRTLSLVYYTSDGSLQLLERFADNSGLDHGVFLRRQVCMSVHVWACLRACVDGWWVGG
jgi:hypothetical protein